LGEVLTAPHHKNISCCETFTREASDLDIYRALVGKHEGKRPLGRPGIDGRRILRWMFRKWDVGGMDWIEPA